MKKIVFILIVFFIANSCHTLKRVQDSNCPINSKYYFIDVEPEFQNCFKKEREYHCGNLLDGGTYGYDIKYVNDVLNLENVESIKALRIKYILKGIDLGKFKNLEYLWLSLDDEIPKNISELKNLKILHLESKSFLKIPDWIGNLSHLEVLSINQADNIFYLTPNISKLSNLKELYLRRFHKLKYQDIDFSKFPKLEKLILNDNTEDLLNKSVLECRNLEQLTTRNFHHYISKLKRLKVLVIGFISKKTDLKGINNLRNLEELFISGSYNKPEIDQLISQIPNLRNLGISFGFTKTTINNHKLKFPKLEYLSVGSFYLDQIPLHECPNLKYLRCFSVEKENHIIVPKEILKYDKLQCLRLGGKGIKKIDFNTDQLSFKLFR